MQTSETLASPILKPGETATWLGCKEEGTGGTCGMVGFIPDDNKKFYYCGVRLPYEGLTEIAAGIHTGPFKSVDEAKAIF